MTTFRTDEAVELANTAEDGLSAAVQSGSRHPAAAVAARLDAGMIHANDRPVDEKPPAPFGGFECSREKAEPFPV